ncbi:hypothetical protein WME91_46405 [Sorangium sp. So ce269]
MSKARRGSDRPIRLADSARRRLSRHAVEVFQELDLHRDPEHTTSPDALRALLEARGLPVYEGALELEGVAGGTPLPPDKRLGVFASLKALEGGRPLGPGKLPRADGKVLLPVVAKGYPSVWIGEGAKVYLVDTEAAGVAPAFDGPAQYLEALAIELETGPWPPEPERLQWHHISVAGREGDRGRAGGSRIAPALDDPAPPQRASARRQPVPDIEALGEAELLQLAHIGLEHGGVDPVSGRELGRAHPRPRLDQRQHRLGPPAAAARAVEPREPPLDLGELTFVERAALAERHPRIRAGEAQRNTMDLPLAAAIAERVEHRLTRWVAGPARIVVADTPGIHDVDRLDRDLADRSAQPPARLHGRTPPSPESERDRARRDALEKRLLEQHGPQNSPASSRCAAPLANGRRRGVARHRRR